MILPGTLADEPWLKFLLISQGKYNFSQGIGQGNMKKIDTAWNSANEPWLKFLTISQGKNVFGQEIGQWNIKKDWYCLNFSWWVLTKVFAN